MFGEKSAWVGIYKFLVIKIIHLVQLYTDIFQFIHTELFFYHLIILTQSK